MVRYIFKLIRVMHSDTDPRQIALGFALGMIMGLTPLTSLHNILVIMAILILRTNISAAIISWAFFSLCAVILDPLFHQIGLAILVKVNMLEGVWTALYNAPLIPYTRFNNSIVMGSLIFSLVIFYPVYRGGAFLVIEYRDIFMERFNQWKVVHIIKASNLYKLYSRYSELKG
jgi:uncharacterized protein (TIGR03546 family)